MLFSILYWLREVSSLPLPECQLEIVCEILKVLSENWPGLEQSQLKISFAAFGGLRVGQALIEHLKACLANLNIQISSGTLRFLATSF